MKRTTLYQIECLIFIIAFYLTSQSLLITALFSILIVIYFGFNNIIEVLQK